jgi:hypothetical protein
MNNILRAVFKAVGVEVAGFGAAKVVGMSARAAVVKMVNLILKIFFGRKDCLLGIADNSD